MCGQIWVHVCSYQEMSHEWLLRFTKTASITGMKAGKEEGDVSPVVSASLVADMGTFQGWPEMFVALWCAVAASRIEMIIRWVTYQAGLPKYLHA